MPNDLPDWFIGQPRNASVAVGSVGLTALNSPGSITAFSPTTYMVYGWAVGGVAEGTSLGGTYGLVQFFLTDNTNTVYLHYLFVATAMPTNVSVMLPAPWRPPGLATTGPWVLKAVLTYRVGTSAVDVSGVVIYG
jgi:hypothetical protein